MFSQYRDKISRLGGNVRQANKLHSEQIMNFGFNSSQNYRRVFINGEYHDAHIITDSKTTVRGGNGNYVIEFRDKDVYFKAGTYVKIPDSHGSYEWWLILYESDNLLFPKHIIKKCNYLLKWKNVNGDIVKRWCVVSDNSKLMDAERHSNFNKITMSYYNTTLILPCDDETINIRVDKRFLIDHEKVMDYPDAWIVTNRNVISKRFDEFDGVIELAISRHQYNHNTDNRKLMIADYYTANNNFEEVDVEASFDCRITYDVSSDLKMGIPFKRYVAEIYCDGIYRDNIPVSWSILADDEVLEHLTYEVSDNICRLKCKNNSALMGSHIRLLAKNQEYGCSAELPIKVVSTL